MKDIALTLFYTSVSKAYDLYERITYGKHYCKLRELNEVYEGIDQSRAEGLHELKTLQIEVDSLRDGANPAMDKKINYLSNIIQNDLKDLESRIQS